jgi:hypothetical protein
MSSQSDISELKRWKQARTLSHAFTAEERSRFDWYGDSCPCELPPGECGQNLQARTAQRPPAGDWRVRCCTGGRGAGKTRAAVCWTLDRFRRGICRHGLAIGPTAQDLRRRRNEPSQPARSIVDRLAVFVCIQSIPAVIIPVRPG